MVKDKWKMNVWAVVTERGSLVRHLENTSIAPMLFRSRWEAIHAAKAVGLGSRAEKVEIRIRRLG